MELSRRNKVISAPEIISMSLVVVSNRVVRPKSPEQIEGGLAAALLPAVTTSGAIWVGSSGRFAQSSEKDSFAEIEALGKGAVAAVDLPEAHYARYYEGFANSALWPVLHSRADLIKTNIDDYTSYREVNLFMARALRRFAKQDAKFWIHDYHFLPLGAEMRRLGIDHPIGFFLHTPFPGRHIISSLPRHRELVRAMLSYDLVGFQTAEDSVNFIDYLRHELQLHVLDGVVTTEQRKVRIESFPIGIDVEPFAERAQKSANRPEVARLRTSLQGAKLVIGVDRVDYSKGISNRLQAFDQMLRMHPHLKRQVSLLQIAVPSRGQIDAYRQLRAELAALVGEINGRHGEVDWTPIRYLNKGYAQSTLSGFYRAAHVGLVTSLHDGMNLVAKEYVAAQDSANPGVLVLSEFAGAAKQLDAAILVNPHDIDALARAISTALIMSLDERVRRWKAMMETLKASSLASWFSDFVTALQSAPGAPISVRPDAGLISFRPRRSDTPVTQVR
jgi:trehalose 6-phosphate synthase